MEAFGLLLHGFTAGDRLVHHVVVGPASPRVFGPRSAYRILEGLAYRYAEASG